MPIWVEIFLSLILISLGAVLYPAYPSSLSINTNSSSISWGYVSCLGTILLSDYFLLILLMAFTRLCFYGAGFTSFFEKLGDPFNSAGAVICIELSLSVLKLHYEPSRQPKYDPARPPIRVFLYLDFYLYFNSSGSIICSAFEHLLIFTPIIFNKK